MYPELLKITIVAISFGFRITILFILVSKKAKKNEFYNPEIGTADNKNALKPPFFAILSPKNGMGGFVIDI